MSTLKIPVITDLSFDQRVDTLAAFAEDTIRHMRTNPHDRPQFMFANLFEGDDTDEILSVLKYAVGAYLRGTRAERIALKGMPDPDGAPHRNGDAWKTTDPLELAILRNVAHYDHEVRAWEKYYERVAFVEGGVRRIYEDVNQKIGEGVDIILEALGAGSQRDEAHGLLRWRGQHAFLALQDQSWRALYEVCKIPEDPERLRNYVVEGFEKQQREREEAVRVAEEARSAAESRRRAAQSLTLNERLQRRDYALFDNHAFTYTDSLGAIGERGCRMPTLKEQFNVLLNEPNDIANIEHVVTNMRRQPEWAGEVWGVSQGRSGVGWPVLSVTDECTLDEDSSGYVVTTSQRIGQKRFMFPEAIKPGETYSIQTIQIVWPALHEHLYGGLENRYKGEGSTIQFPEPDTVTPLIRGAETEITGFNPVFNPYSVRPAPLREQHAVARMIRVQPAIDFNPDGRMAVEAEPPHTLEDVVQGGFVYLGESTWHTSRDMAHSLPGRFSLPTLKELLQKRETVIDFYPSVSSTEVWFLRRVPDFVPMGNGNDAVYQLKGYNDGNYHADREGRYETQESGLILNAEFICEGDIEQKVFELRELEENIPDLYHHLVGDQPFNELPERMQGIGIQFPPLNTFLPMKIVMGQVIGSRCYAIEPQMTDTRATGYAVCREPMPRTQAEVETDLANPQPVTNPTIAARIQNDRLAGQRRRARAETPQPAEQGIDADDIGAAVDAAVRGEAPQIIEPSGVQPVVFENLVLYGPDGQPVRTYRQVILDGDISARRMTQYGWIEHYRGTTKELPSLPLLYAMIEQMVLTNHPAREALLADLCTDWIATSTGINYIDNTVTHSYHGSAQPTTYPCHIPDGNHFLRDVQENADWQTALKTLIMPRTVALCFPALETFSRGEPCIFTPDENTRRDYHPRAAFVKMVENRFELNCNIYFGGTAHSRGVIIQGVTDHTQLTGQSRTPRLEF